MPDDDFDYLTHYYRRLGPSGHDQFQRMVARRARDLRTEFLRELWRQFRSWRQRRAALAQLHALDDASLKDIGLHRSGIEAAVSGRARPAVLTPRSRQAFPEKPQLCLQRTG